MIRRFFVSALIALFLAALAPLAGTPSFADATTLTLQGIVADSLGHPVAGAFVSDGTTAQTNAQGQYTLQIQPSDTSATVWAPGYNPEQLTLQLPPGLSSGDDINFNFSGSFGLSSAFANPAAHAQLRGLPTVIASTQTAVDVTGSADVPLESHVYVTVPNGRVHLFRLHDLTGNFAARLPFHQDGVYRVEINAANGFSLFNVLIFRGVTPYLPTDNPAPDPVNATAHQLSAFALHLINAARHQAGLRKLHMLRRLILAARTHNKDMVVHHFFLDHPHTGSDGSTPLQRITSADPAAQAVGENVAEAGTIGQAVQTLFDSPAHRAILLGHFHWVGVAVCHDHGRYLITIDFVH